MAKKEAGDLVIVESPAKAKTIEKYLGDGFTVLSSYGHVRDLPERDLSVDVDNGFEPTYIIPDDKKDRLFASAGIPFMRLRPVGSPSENTIRAQVAEHVDELVRSLRADLPGYDQARGLLESLSCVRT